MRMKEKELAVCDECGSLFFKERSKMKALCPECAIFSMVIPTALIIFKMAGVFSVIGMVPKVTILNI